MKKEGKGNWPEWLTFIIPTVGMVLFAVYNITAMLIDSMNTIQDSVGFDKLLETIVTFISIVLSVFGFLIPAFLSSKGSNLLIQYFLNNADTKAFVRQLKNVVAMGLIDVFLTCILFLNDIFSTSVMNIFMEIWLWCILYFMCVSYRFISILLSVMVGTKEDRKKEVINEASKQTTNELKSIVRKI